MDLTKAIGIAKEKKVESDAKPKTWKEELPSSKAKSQMLHHQVMQRLVLKRRKNMKKLKSVRVVCETIKNVWSKK